MLFNSFRILFGYVFFGLLAIVVYAQVDDEDLDEANPPNSPMIEFFFENIVQGGIAQALQAQAFNMEVFQVPAAPVHLIFAEFCGIPGEPW